MSVCNQKQITNFFFQNNVKLLTINLTEISKYPEIYFLFCMEVYILSVWNKKKKNETGEIARNQNGKKYKGSFQ